MHKDRTKYFLILFRRINKKLSKPLGHLKHKSQRGVLTMLLIGAVLLWFLMKMDGSYTATLTLRPEYFNFPQGMVFDKMPQEKLKVSAQGLGRNLFSYGISNKTIKIDVEKVIYCTGNDCYWEPGKFLQLIEQELGGGTKVLGAEPERIHFSTDRTYSKKLEVRLKDIRTSFAYGFTDFSGWKIDPPEVYVYGEKAVIDKLKNISISSLEFKDVSEPIEKTISLSDYYPESISFKPEEVTLKLDVAEYTEGEVSVPIEVINEPYGYFARIYPSHVQVTYTVATKNFSRISARDFKVTADFRNIGSQRRPVYLKISKSPESVKNITLSESKVDFILKRN